MKRIPAFRITMDYDEFNFDDLRKEYEKENTATWYIKSKYPKIKDVFDEYGSEKIDAYFYCFNMPDKLNKFVFKGKIKDVLKNDSSKKYPTYNYKIIFDNIKVFKEEDSLKLAIRRSDKLKFNPQGTYAELNDEVLEILKLCDAPYDLMTFLNKFTGCECFFAKENIKCADMKHTSFLKDNREKYVEFHHLIFRNFGYDDSKLLKELDFTSDNYIQLCPACHRAIHYGKKELKEKILKIVLKKRIDQLEKIYNKSLNNKSFQEKVKKYNPKDFKDFMYKIYEINKD